MKHNKNKRIGGRRELTILENKNRADEGMLRTKGDDPVRSWRIEAVDESCRNPGPAEDGPEFR